MSWLLSRYMYLLFSSYNMFNLVITNIWPKVNDMTLTRYSTMALIFWGWYFVKRNVFKYSQVFMLFSFDVTHVLFLLHFILCNILWFLKYFPLILISKFYVKLWRKNFRVFVTNQVYIYILYCSLFLRLLCFIAPKHFKIIISTSILFGGGEGGGGYMFPAIRLTLKSVYKYIFRYFPGSQHLLEIHNSSKPFLLRYRADYLPFNCIYSIYLVSYVGNQIVCVYIKFLSFILGAYFQYCLH